MCRCAIKFNLSFTARPGRCDNGDFGCEKEYPYSMTSVFHCYHDYQCPQYFKCCQPNCFKHKVCQPTIIDTDSDFTTTEKMEIISTQKPATLTEETTTKASSETMSDGRTNGFPTTTKTTETPVQTVPTTPTTEEKAATETTESFSTSIAPASPTTTGLSTTTELSTMEKQRETTITTQSHPAEITFTPSLTTDQLELTNETEEITATTEILETTFTLPKTTATEQLPTLTVESFTEARAIKNPTLTSERAMTSLPMTKSTTTSVETETTSDYSIPFAITPDQSHLPVESKTKPSIELLPSTPEGTSHSDISGITKIKTTTDYFTSFSIIPDQPYLPVENKTQHPGELLSSTPKGTSHSDISEITTVKTTDHSTIAILTTSKEKPITDKGNGVTTPTAEESTNLISETPVKVTAPKIKFSIEATLSPTFPPISSVTSPKSEASSQENLISSSTEVAKVETTSKKFQFITVAETDDEDLVEGSGSGDGIENAFTKEHIRSISNKPFTKKSIAVTADQEIEDDFDIDDSNEGSVGEISSALTTTEAYIKQKAEITEKKVVNKEIDKLPTTGTTETNIRKKNDVTTEMVNKETGKSSTKASTSHFVEIVSGKNDERQEIRTTRFLNNGNEVNKLIVEINSDKEGRATINLVKSEEDKMNTIQMTEKPAILISTTVESAIAEENDGAKRVDEVLKAEDTLEFQQVMSTTIPYNIGSTLDRKLFFPTEQPDKSGQTKTDKSNNTISNFSEDTKNNSQDTVPSSKDKDIVYRDVNTDDSYDDEDVLTGASGDREYENLPAN